MRPYLQTPAEVSASYPTEVYTPEDHVDATDSGFAHSESLASLEAPYLYELDYLPARYPAPAVTVGGAARAVVAYNPDLPPSSGQVAISFDFPLIQCAADDDGLAVEIDYLALGSVPTARHSNKLQKEVQATQERVNAMFDGTGELNVESVQANSITVDGVLTANQIDIVGGSINQYSVSQLNVADKTVRVNDGGTDATAAGAGLEVEGTSGATKASLVYDSSLASGWKAGKSTQAEVVTTSDAQTLTNKALTTPTVNGSALTATGTQLNTAASTAHYQNSDTGTNAADFTINANDEGVYYGQSTAYKVTTYEDDYDSVPMTSGIVYDRGHAAQEHWWLVCFNAITKTLGKLKAHTLVATHSLAGPGSQITNINASNLASGTVPVARMAGGTNGLLFRINQAEDSDEVVGYESALSGGNVVGTYWHEQDECVKVLYNYTTLVPFQASAFYGSGQFLSALNANNITSGTVPDARLPVREKLIGVATTGAYYGFDIGVPDSPSYFTVFPSTFFGTKTLAAADWYVGKTYRVTITGHASMEDTWMLACLKIGAHSHYIEAGRAGAGAGTHFRMTFDIVCRATGASGTLAISGGAGTGTGAGGSGVYSGGGSTEVATSIDLTVNRDLDFQVYQQYDGENVTVNNVIIEALN